MKDKKVWSLKILLLGCLGVSLAMLSCRQKAEDKKENLEKHEQAMSETYVDTMTLHVTPFDKQIVCNGRLRAKAKSDLNFFSSLSVSASDLDPSTDPATERLHAAAHDASRMPSSGVIP